MLLVRYLSTENALGAIFVNRECSWCDNWRDVCQQKMLSACDICRQKCSCGGDVERTCGRTHAATKSVLRNRSCHLQSLRLLSLAKFATLVICKVCESSLLIVLRQTKTSSFRVQVLVCGIFLREHPNSFCCKIQTVCGSAI